MHPLLVSRGQKPRTGDVIPCAICGTEFYRQPAYIAQNRRFCSSACNTTWQTKTPVVITCDYCGTQFKVRPCYAGRRFCKKPCEAAWRTKRLAGRDHNGKPVLVNAQGYLTVFEPKHPARNRSGRVLEHRFVVETLIGRFLRSDEHVDHINRNKQDNRPENLQVMTSSDHSKKTNRDKMTAQSEMLARLAEYERRFGSLD